MKRELKKRKDQTLCEWRERIAPLCTGMTTEQLLKALREVSVTSYAVGSDATLALRKSNRLTIGAAKGTGTWQTSAANGDRYMADKYATYPSPWQRVNRKRKNER